MGRFGNKILRARCPICGLVTGVKHLERLFRLARRKQSLVTEQESRGRGQLSRAAELISLNDRACREYLDDLQLGNLLDALLESFVSLANVLSSNGLISRAQYQDLRIRASVESVHLQMGRLVDSGAIREVRPSAPIPMTAFKAAPVVRDDVSFNDLLATKFRPQKVVFEEA